MNHIYALSASVVASLAIAFGAATLASGSDSSPREIAPAGHDNSVVKQAEQYVGDPWEQRFREQFWTQQHVHDSWNRCHLGENVSAELLLLSGC
jgi:hypothetical protein